MGMHDTSSDAAAFTGYKGATPLCSSAKRQGLRAEEQAEAPPKTKNTGDSMNWDRIEGKWKQSVGKVKEKWGKLTDDDIEVIAGRRDQLVGRIQERYGIAKDAAERQVDDFARAFASEDRTEDSTTREKARGRGQVVSRAATRFARLDQ